jgi:hypothetical protein
VTQLKNKSVYAFCVILRADEEKRLLQGLGNQFRIFIQWYSNIIQSGADTEEAKNEELLEQPLI